MNLTSSISQFMAQSDSARQVILTSTYSGVVPLFDFRLGIRCTEKALLSLEFLAPDTPLLAPNTNLANTVVQQVAAYAGDADFIFTLTMSVEGTIFQQRVWHEIRRIKRGQYTSYGQIAANLDSKPRPVGQACGHNPFPLIIPCHRVLSKKGLG